MNSHHSYFGDFLVEDSPPEPLLRATVEGVETIYLLNYSSAQHSMREVTIPELIQLGGLQIMPPAVTWVTNTSILLLPYYTWSMILPMELQL